MTTKWKLRASTLVLASVLPFPGCGPGETSEPASPSVSADSEAGLKALAEDEALRKARQEQEAKARKRIKGLPEEG